MNKPNYIKSIKYLLRVPKKSGFKHTENLEWRDVIYTSLFISLVRHIHIILHVFGVC